MSYRVMKQERVILSFVMVLIGLLVAGGAFFFYQSTKTVTTNKEIAKTELTPTPTPNSSFFLLVNDPKDESIVNKKTITITGKTDPKATVVILTSSDQEIIQPSKQGDFNTTIAIGNGVNYIKIQAISPTGEVATVQRVIAYTTEDF